MMNDEIFHLLTILSEIGQWAVIFILIVETFWRDK